MKAIIVTGDRNAIGAFYDVVDRAIGRIRTDIVIHGACGIDADDDFEAKDLRGIDRYAHYAGCGVIPMPAPFKREGLKGGPMRNTAMLRVLMQLKFVGYEVSVHAFHDDPGLGKGTRDMVKQARAAGVPVTWYRSDGTSEVMA